MYAVLYSLHDLMMAFFFYQELTAIGGRNVNAKVGRKISKKERENLMNMSMPQNRDKKGKAGSSKVNLKITRNRPQRHHKVEPLIKEEGEMSDNEEMYEQFREVKWMEWCEDVMVSEVKTLKRLSRLQTTSADLPKEKVQLISLSFFCFFFSILFQCEKQSNKTLITLKIPGAFQNSKLFAASRAKDRSNCLGI